MRRISLAIFLAAYALVAGAQSAARSRPTGTVPLEEVPPPPPLAQQESQAADQAVTRRMEDGQLIEEYRTGGKLVMQRVTPRHGRSYVLMDHKGDGSFTKMDNSIDGHLSVPQWVLMEF